MKTTLEISKLPDADLLEYICTENNDEVAYNEFVNRYIKDIQDVCEKLCGWRKLDSHIGLQIAHDAFEKVRRLKSYKKDSTKPDQKKAIIGFFYTVCQNLFNDHHNKNKKKNEYVPRVNYFNQITDLTKSSALTNEEIKEFTEKILKKLNDKEKRVLFADIEYKRYQSYLPDEVVAKLCEELNVKEPTIRKIRERAINKIKKEIDVINGQ